jgi:predicted lysophospholipase L1 biosynthesis ABC-type transport system permease subunit
MNQAPPTFSTFWLTPVVAGAALVLIGLLIFKHPELLAYFVAGVFVAAGLALIGMGWNLRRRVTYRRLDADWNGPADRD